MDNSYIQTLIDNGEYDELLTFLLTVLPDTKVELDPINDCVNLYIGQAEYIEEMDETITQFKLRVSKLKKKEIGWSTVGNIRKDCSEYIKKHIEAATIDNNQIDGLSKEQLEYLSWFIQGLRQIGIKLEEWQKEDLRNIFALQIKKRMR